MNNYPEGTEYSSILEEVKAHRKKIDALRDKIIEAVKSFTHPDPLHPDPLLLETRAVELITTADEARWLHWNLLGEYDELSAFAYAVFLQLATFEEIKEHCCWLVSGSGELDDWFDELVLNFARMAELKALEVKNITK